MLTFKIRHTQEIFNGQGNEIKPEIAVDYNRHMNYVDKGDRMVNSYSISHRTWKWTKKLFFHLFDLANLNNCILLSSCRGKKKISQRDFQLALLRNVLAVVGHERWLERSVGRPTTASANIGRLDTSFKKQHWPGLSKPGRCHVYSAIGVTWKVCVTCLKCDVALCVGKMCFAVISQTSSCATPIHKFEAWNQNVSKRWIFTNL
jgi:hypothetical protein